MKQNLRILGLGALLLSMYSAYAYDFESGGIYYDVLSESDKTVAVTYKDNNYNSYAGQVDIPGNVTNGGITYKVTQIGKYAFEKTFGLKTVTIPNSVTSIEGYAFYNSGIISVYIGTGVTTIGGYAFSGCTSLASVEIPNSVTTIGKGAFYDCTQLYKVVLLPNSVPSGLSDAFNSLTGRVTYVANNNYSGSYLGTIKEYKYLSSMFVVDGVKYVPVSPSERTCDIIDYDYNTLPSTVNVFDKIVNQGIELTVLNINSRSFYNTTSLCDILIKNAGDIGDYAFYGCINLQKANINNAGDIGKYAFYGCSNLPETNINNAGRLGDYVFGECHNLQKANIMSEITYLGACCFKNATKLTSVILPQTLEILGDGAFSGCSSLLPINFPSALRKIGSSCFEGCSTFEEIIIPASITHIGGFTFSNCASLSKVTFEDGELEIELGTSARPSSSIFRGSPLTEVFIGRNFNYDTKDNPESSPFHPCGSTLKKVIISDLPSTVLPYEFYGCTSLTDVTIGDGVTEIGEYAFSGCSSIERFTFGDGVKTIGKEAFSGCTAMTTLVAEATTPPACGNHALDDINKWNCKLYTPHDAIDAYKSAEQWKEFFFYEQLYIVDRLLFVQTSDALVSVLFSDSPKIMFPENQLALTFNDCSYQWAFDDFYKWYFGRVYSTDESGINDVLADTSDISIRFDNNIVKVSAQKGINVSICDISGRILVTADGCAEIDMSKYPADVYIVRAGNKYVKFLKK